jgi:glutathionyl-hydroquinone reductase
MIESGVGSEPIRASHSQIDARNAKIDGLVNNGAYRAGFAATQAVYEEDVCGISDERDRLDSGLADRPYALGPVRVPTDWRPSVTLIRFDAVHVGHFKRNVRRIADYPNLEGDVRDLYYCRGVGDTVNMDDSKRHYYGTHDELNLTRIFPIGPALDLSAAHGREVLG